MKKLTGLIVVLCGCIAETDSTENVGQAGQAIYSFSTHQVFDSTTGLSANEQWGTDPFIQVASDGKIYVSSTSIPRDPLLTNGDNLWRSSDNGATWSFLGNAELSGLAAEGSMALDSSGRLWKAELPYAHPTPIYRFDNPATITDRSTDYDQVVLGTPTGERSWISSYGNRIHVQWGEALVIPGVRISFNGAANPPVFTSTIPVATNPALLAEIIPVPGATVVGISQGPLVVNQSNGKMCAPLTAVNGDTVNYMPGHSLWTACSDDGLTWTNTLIYKNLNVSMKNFWSASAIDVAGNMYFLVAANMDTAGSVISGMNIFMFVSTDDGVTWSGPKKVNSGGGTHLFPRAVAGCDGGINVVWYGTSTAGNPQSMVSTAEWRFYMSQSKTATAATPTWAEVDVAGSIVHYGPLNHKGTFNSGVDARILTIPNITLDGDGKAHVVWQDVSTPWSGVNPNANPATQYMGVPAFSPLYHGRQTAGAALDSCQ